jgi:hypothetical protein
MRLPAPIRAEFQRHGRRGGQARARRLSSDARSAGARLAAIRRWVRERFGEPTFATLGLPGGEAVDRGLADLAAGRETPESLMVSLAASRLRREGVPVPRGVFADADHRLYRHLERIEGDDDLAHARYLARLELLRSFADACASVRRERS